jgi:microcystin-dependent protein
LFSLLGTTYGGDGRITFALPDLRGRVPVGFGQGTGLTTRDLGQTGGAEQVALTVDQMPAHSHTANASSASADSTSPAGNLLAVSKSKEIYSTAGASATLNPAAIGSAGGGQPHENMPPFLTLNCIIALEGIFPAQN